MDDLEVITLMRLGFEDRQLDDLLAQGLDVVSERRGFSGGHEVVGSFPVSDPPLRKCVERTLPSRFPARCAARLPLPLGS